MSATETTLSPPAVDDPKRINDVLALLDQTFLSETTASRPTHFDIAVSVVCNIKCPFCPRQTFGPPEIRSGLMKEEHFDPLVPHLGFSHRTGLYGLGEPFLNKNFFPYLEASKATGSYCMTSTHGMSLTSEMIDKVLDSELDELCVSMDGPTKGTFQFLRDGADFETVKANVSELLRRRKARGQSHPRVHIACAISKYNVWQMSAMVRMTLEMGADRLAFSNLVLDHPEHAHASIIHSPIFRFNLKRAKALAAKLGLDCVYFMQKPFPWRAEPPPSIDPGVRYGCPAAWRGVIVERDGNIKPCCYIDVSYGNTAETPLPDAYNGKAALALRKSFIDRNYNEGCKGCGQFVQVTDAATKDLIERAEAGARDGNFSDGVRERLLHVIGHYRELAQKSMRS